MEVKFKKYKRSDKGTNFEIKDSPDGVLIIKNGKIKSPKHPHPVFNLPQECIISMNESVGVSERLGHYTHIIKDAKGETDQRRTFFVDATWLQSEKIKWMEGSQWIQLNKGWAFAVSVSLFIAICTGINTCNGIKAKAQTESVMLGIDSIKNLINTQNQILLKELDTSAQNQYRKIK